MIPTELDHLSYSSISSYLACGHNWRMHYLDKIKTGTTPALLFGSAFHGTIEGYLKKEGDISDLWRANWANQIEKNPDVDWDGTPEEHHNNGLRMLTHKDVLEGLANIHPGQDAEGIRIERKVELRVPGVPLPIVGYIDIITNDGVPGDFKTSSMRWTDDKALAETQPLFYLAALNQMGETVPGWRFRHFVFVKTKTPQFQRIEHTHNPAQLMWLFKQIRSVWAGIEAGVFPLNSGGWKCSPSYCDYWHLCRGKQ
jgi:putative RecB family exonuclease